MTKGQLSSLWKKFKNPFYLLVIGITFLFCAFTLHDIQSSQGVGLYLSMQFGQNNVLLFNLLVDCLGMLLLFIATFLPCLCMKRLQTDSVFRFFSVYLAMIPTIRPASLVHLGNTLANLTIRQISAAEKPFAALLDSLFDAAQLLRTLLPFLLVLVWINRTTATEKWKKWQIGILIAEVFFVILNILFPALSTETAYFMNYLLVVWGFYEWEKVCDRFPRFSSWGMILFGGCWLRGIYRMIELMSIVNF